ncbi:hypothetical protein [Spirochaeta isovalerica]|uniref:Uncharacterized protein n=1 Tax=Spirochaeta isovalerica TaxID=150 RepID=A0A841R6X8_9SPIO|nr:hypothetical protein [Spirochaeta isovalerica]MBB6479131.1 hypothetical protein [Spirochaeta isovalerica]
MIDIAVQSQNDFIVAFTIKINREVQFRNPRFTGTDIIYLNAFQQLLFFVFIDIEDINISQFLILVNGCEIKFFFAFAVKIDEFDVFVILDLYTGEIHTF